VHVSLELLRRSESILVALREDGWRVESGPGVAVCARHPRVPDENAARRRLQRLGLLTSGSLRIEFCHPGPKEGAERDS
jgi:hypothetical protein